MALDQVADDLRIPPFGVDAAADGAARVVDDLVPLDQRRAVDAPIPTPPPWVGGALFPVTTLPTMVGDA